LVLATVADLIRGSLGLVLAKRAPRGLQQTTTIDDNPDKAFVAEIRSIVNRRAAVVQAELQQLPPDDWDIQHEPTWQAVERAALDLCETTRADIEAQTLQEADRVIEEIRRQILEGMQSGESVTKVTNRIGQYFDRDLRWKARRIARTESTRAYNMGTYIVGMQSEVVAGWQWVLSTDACPWCVEVGTVNGKPRRVMKDQPFAVGQSDNPVYSVIPYPPLHPHCRCTSVAIIDEEFDGSDPTFTGDEI